MDISIVIPTWRGRHLLEAYLPSVIKAAKVYSEIRGCRTEIVVVEDAGGDDTMQWLRSRYEKEVNAVAHEKNQGFCAACQTGFLHARFPIVLLLNNDVRLEADCIDFFVGHFEDPTVFAVTGKMYNQKGDIFCNGGKIGQFRRGMWSSYLNYDVLSPDGIDEPLLSFAAIGAFSAYDREKFLSIGGFDPLTAMYEDIEISYRGWKRGWLVKYEPRSVAYHDASQTMSRRYKYRSRDRLSRRSRILMHWILLHDRGMFAVHLASIVIRFVVSWLRLDWPFYWAVLTGLRNLGVIRRKRKENRNAAKRSDREILLLLKRFYRAAPIVIRNV
ncbi:MAG: glycosyltransferase [Acidobacteria bacterium]|nr:glycosyltransferase [Acidobacteriota bacterium]